MSQVAPDLASQLEQLSNLHKIGQLTDAEFTAAKSQLIHQGSNITLPIAAASTSLPFSSSMHFGGEPPIVMATTTVATRNDENSLDLPIAINLDGGNIRTQGRFETVRNSSLAKYGVPDDVWNEVCDDIDRKILQADPFYSCPNIGTCYWCCPLGPVQFVLCCFNPITCCIYSQVDTNLKSVNLTLKEKLGPYINASLRRGEMMQPCLYLELG
eukprot:g2464.t1